MRKLLAIVVCKLGRFVGKLIGKGSSMPGKFALKICPDILRRVQLPPHIIAVTGSNGKTSTVEMIASILRAAGKDEAISLTPPRRITLEEGLSYIQEDELLEVTPKTIRLRKRILDPILRKRSANKIA